jgi:hypothetical protein
MTAEKSGQSTTEERKIVVVKKHATCNGRELFKVRGDENGWCSTVQEAVDRHNRCRVWWENYHKSGGKK